MDPKLLEMAVQIAQRIETEQAKELGYKHTAPSGTPTTNYMHGPGGIFGQAGLERDLLSTRVAPMGLAGALLAKGTINTNPLFPYLSGFQADTGDNPDGVCDECQVAGPTKSCFQTAQFGRYCRNTKEIEVNRVGQRTNRGEFLDLRLVNDPLLQNMGGLLNMNIPGTPNLVREVLMAMVEVGVSFQNLLCPQVYSGNPANNSAGGGYKEFPGLDILIGTNKIDAITGVECPSLNSDIKDFNYGMVDGADPDIVQVVTMMYRYLKYNATHMGYLPVKWVITMRPDLFYELTDVWPCRYMSYRCSVIDGPNIDAEPTFDTGDAIAMRDAMRNGKYLLIDGEKVPIIEDNGITEETDADSDEIAAGQFASDIYFIPMSVRGGLQTTYFEYLDYSEGAMQAVQDGKLGPYFWTDGGRFLWHTKPPTNWCAQWMAKIEPRLILLTPFLAGRIQNVKYEPLQHFREPFPSDPYFANGGKTSREGPSYYSDWNDPRQ